MNVKIADSWKTYLQEEFEKPYFQELAVFVRNEYKNHTVYPPPKKIFAAFDYCPFEKLKAVILGQDPYHGAGQANGLCFSVADGVPSPPSLLNIFKEVKADLGTGTPPTGSLERWAKQGVLLLNATLTVRAKQAGSHQGKGWERFTDAVIQLVSENKQDLVFILWGSYAQHKGEVIDKSKHYVLSSSHPSPFSADRGFFGSRPFSQTNRYLQDKNLSPIEW